jgi:DNA-directed RNA polymerase subunit RPC12/RpoP
MEGMKLSTETDEGKMIAALVDTIGQIASSISDLEENAIAVSDELDEIEETLDAMEDFLLDEFDEDDEDEDEEDEEDEDDFDFDDDEIIYEVECPACGEIINIDEDMLEEGSISCPNCGEELEFDLDDEEDEE